LELVGTLLAAGADPNARDKFENTPLALAALNGSCEQMQLLLKHGADPNAVDKYGETALHRAVSNQVCRRCLAGDHAPDARFCRLCGNTLDA
jgi:ankyrin repeat protein